MRYRVLSASNTLIITSFLSGLGIVVAILCVIAGISSSAFENSAIATFDTSGLLHSLQQDNTSAPQISEWYSLHLTTVCHGSWTADTANRTAGITKEKNNSTMTCDSHGLSWNFRLGSAMSANPTRDLLTANDIYHANLAVPSGLMTAGIVIGFVALTGIFAASFKHGFGKLTHAVCVAGVVLEFVSAILVLSASATLTVIRGRLLHAQPGVPGVTAFATSSYLTLLWIAAVVPICAGLIGIVGQHKEKRMHAEAPKMAPIKVPSISTTGSTGSNSGGRSRGQSLASQQGGRSRGQSLASHQGGRSRGNSNITVGYGTTAPQGRNRGSSAGVASLRLGPTSTVGSTQSTSSETAGPKGRDRRESLGPTSGSFGARRYGVKP